MTERRTKAVLGLDFGASNGRGILGEFDGNAIQFHELNRFANRHINIRNSLYWNPLAMIDNLRQAAYQAIKNGEQLSSIAIDSWAQDFGIIDGKGNLLYIPQCYRDPRGKDGLEKLQHFFPSSDFFMETGTIPKTVNTISQLIAMKDSSPNAFEEDNTLLFLSNLLGFWITGELGCEESVLSMSGLYNNKQHLINTKVLQCLDIPTTLFPQQVSQLCPLGKWNDNTVPKLISDQTEVITIPHHDTAAAFTVISAFDNFDTIYISLGTWGVCGIRVEEAVINTDLFEAGINNMIGLLGEHYLTSNMTGLWIEQQCRLEWEQSGYIVQYDKLDEFAWFSRFPAVIDTEAYEFSVAGNMTQKIQNYCKQNSLPVPLTVEEVYSCVINSLAIKLWKKIQQLISFSTKNYVKIHIVGGGSRNLTLCKLIAEYSQKNVQRGPIEATLTGNILSQYLALGEISNLQEAKCILENSFDLINIT